MMRRIVSPIERYFINGLIILALLAISSGWAAASDSADALQEPMIIIDPGHGGHDAGAHGPGGSVEKKINLEFANVLKETLQPGYQVKLTRTGDYRVSLKKRASVANHQGGALFISLHSGGSVRAGLEEWAVYYFAPNESRARSGVPRQANDASAGRSLDWRKVQAKLTRVSRSLAETVADHLENSPDIGRVESSGVPLLLLEGIDMPAVIVEAGYLTNPACEGRLSDPDFLAAAAQCLRNGIDAFFQEKQERQDKKKDNGLHDD